MRPNYHATLALKLVLGLVLAKYILDAVELILLNYILGALQSVFHQRNFYVLKTRFIYPMIIAVLAVHGCLAVLNEALHILPLPLV